MKTTSAMLILTAATVMMALMAAGCGEPEKAPTTKPTPEPTVKPVAPPEPVAQPKPVAPPEPEPLAVQPSAADTAAFNAFAKAATLPVARVPVVLVAPKIDGVLDDAYAAATQLTLSAINGEKVKLNGPTTVHVVSTTDTLYIYARCDTPNPDDLLTDIAEHDGSVWNDDCIELFIDPTNERNTYAHIQVNAIGTTADAKGNSDDFDSSWEPKIKVSAKVDSKAKAWVVEMAIPLADLVDDVNKINRVWAANFNRMAYLLDGTEDTAWSPTGTDQSHVPEKFGLLWMDVGTVSKLPVGD